MINYIGINKDSKQFKGNLHCHTTNSDGNLVPSKLKQLYKSNGYSFIAFTDHEIYTDYREELNDKDFIVLPGIEASANLLVDGIKVKTHHVLGILGTSKMQQKVKEAPLKHLEKVIPPVKVGDWDGLCVAQDLVNSLYHRGLIVTYNHPIWSRVSLQEFKGLKNIWALEIYNYGTEIECALGYDLLHWDNMLSSGIKICGFASDDNHNQENLFDSLGGAIIVCADKLSHDDILESMLNGNFYSSSGIKIWQWGIRDNVVYIDCEPVRKINFIVGGKIGDGESIYCENLDDTITHAEYLLKGTETYIRIECIDKYGRTSWTNPYYLKN